MSNFLAALAGRNTPARSYTLVGNEVNKVFNALGALGTLAFAFNNVILCVGAPHTLLSSHRYPAAALFHSSLLRYSAVWWRSDLSCRAERATRSVEDAVVGTPG